MISTIKLIAFYLASLLLGAIIFFALFYFNFLSSIDILFYRGLVILAVAAVIHWVISFWFLQISKFTLPSQNIHIANAIVAIALCFNVAFFMIVPVSLDRSVSVFLLGYMNATNTPMSKQDLKTAFTDIYLTKYDAIDRRVNEQLFSQNIKDAGNQKFILTTNGKRFIDTSIAIANIFNIDTKFLIPKSTPNVNKQRED